MKRKKQGLRADNPQLPIHSREKSAKNLALSNFDQYYSQFYGERWNSIRLALLCRPKYCAVVNNFGDPEETVKKLTALGCINVTQTFNKRNSARLLHAGSDPSTSVDDDKDSPSSHEFEPRSEETIEEESPTSFSLNTDSIAGRYIDPEERVIGDMSTAIYDFVPTDKLKGNEDFVEESDHYSFYKTPEINSLQIVKCDNLKFPRHLQVYMFPRNV